MSWTYSNNPAASDLDAVRFTIGDTDIGDQLVSDEEVTYLLLQGGSPLYASILATENLACKFARQADCKVGEVSRSAGKIAEHFRECSKLLRGRFLRLGHVKPRFGGISYAKERSLNEDRDLKSGFATIGQFDNPPGLEFRINKLYPLVPGGQF